jgi:hypothetical protein
VLGIQFCWHAVCMFCTWCDERMTQMFPIESMSDDSQTSRVQFLNTCAPPSLLPFSVIFLLTEIRSIEWIIMLKKICTLFSHSILKKLIMVCPHCFLNNRARLCSDNAPALPISLLLCSNLTGYVVHEGLHHLFSSPEINSNKSRWAWHIEWIGKRRTNFGLVTTRDTRNGIQSAEEITLLKRIRNIKIWTFAIYYIPLQVSSTMCSSSGG